LLSRSRANAPNGQRNNSHQNNHAANLAQYFESLKLCLLSSNSSRQIKKNHFYWEFDVKLSTFSRIYKVLLIWDFSKNSPSVYILNDEVHKIVKERTIPHLYSHEKIQLCLHYPKYKDFSKSMSLCETIVPWTYLWISYYEEWLYSNEWKGDGVHIKSSELPRPKGRSFLETPNQCSDIKRL